jgi:hypothetical protein
MSVTLEQAILDKIRTRGYWRVVIRPTTFDEQHIPNYSDLFSIVEKNAVRLRGWDFPHIDYQSAPLRGADWVGQEFDCQDEIEIWRIHMSGQFVCFFTIWGDWRDHSSVWPTEPGWKAGRYIYYTPTVYSFVEIFEFAVRLALSPASAASMTIEIQLHNLQGRQVVSTDIMVPVSGVYDTQMPDWNRRWEGPQTDLIARPRELAAEAARDFFERFGLNLSLESLTRVQARIGR